MAAKEAEIKVVPQEELWVTGIGDRLVARSTAAAPVERASPAHPAGQSVPSSTHTDVGCFPSNGGASFAETLSKICSGTGLAGKQAPGMGRLFETYPWDAVQNNETKSLLLRGISPCSE